jgi:hypothetical protein
MNVRLKRPSPALVVAIVALLVALGGTARAGITGGAVPLAKRAILADNAKRLRGQSPAQIAATATNAALAASPAGPRPASSAATLVTITTVSGSVAAGESIHTFYAVCGFQQKLLGGGFRASAPVVVLASYPEADDRWTVIVRNPDPVVPVLVTASATCTR